MSHVITIEPHSHPDTFTATCSCGEMRTWNAFKWIVLEIQAHYVASGLTRSGRGLIIDSIVGDGMEQLTRGDAA